MKLKENDIVLFSGDSITHGGRGESMDCNHIMGHGFQFIVSAKLAAENLESQPKFVNKGYSGATMSDLLRKWQTDVIANKPTVLNILAGTNDGLCGFHNGMTVEQAAENYRKNLESAVELTKELLLETKIIICEPFFFPIYDKTTDFKFVPHPYCEENHGRPDLSETEEMIQYRIKADELIRKYAKQTAEKYGTLFVPLYDALKNAIGKSRTEYIMWDGTHPTVAGHFIIAEEWLKVVDI